MSEETLSASEDAPEIETRTGEFTAPEDVPDEPVTRMNHNHNNNLPAIIRPGMGGVSISKMFDADKTGMNIAKIARSDNTFHAYASGQGLSGVRNMPIVIHPLIHTSIRELGQSGEPWVFEVRQELRGHEATAQPKFRIWHKHNSRISFHFVSTRVPLMRFWDDIYQVLLKSNFQINATFSKIKSWPVRDQEVIPPLI